VKSFSSSDGSVSNKNISKYNYAFDPDEEENDNASAGGDAGSTHSKKYLE